MGKRGEGRKRELPRLRKLEKQNPQIQSSNNLNKTEPFTIDIVHKKDKKVSKFSYFMRAVVSIGAIYLSTIVGDKLMELSFVLGYIFPIIILSFCFGYWTWEFTCRFNKWKPFSSLIGKMISIFIVIVIIWLSMPLYIDYLPQQGRMEFEQPYFDSTQVLVHYGTRKTDFFWTQTTVGELKKSSNVALNVNGQDIFKITTDGRQIFINAILFNGYTNKTMPDYATIGSPDKFSIQMTGYLNTDAVGYPKYFDRKVPDIVIKNKALAQQVTITNNAFDWQPNGWRILNSSKAFEVINANSIPVLIVEYKNPYEITISGLFLTSFGILKVDNSFDTIFEFGDSPFELGTYTVDTIKPHSVFDLFRNEKTYILYDKGR